MGILVKNLQIHLSLLVFQRIGKMNAVVRAHGCVFAAMQEKRLGQGGRLGDQLDGSPRLRLGPFKDIFDRVKLQKIRRERPGNRAKMRDAM